MDTIQPFNTNKCSNTDLILNNVYFAPEKLQSMRMHHTRCVCKNSVAETCKNASIRDESELGKN